MTKTLIRYLPLLLLALVWEMAARFEWVSTTALPPLSDVVRAWIELMLDGELLRNSASSLYRIAGGLGLAIVVGTILGIGMAVFECR